MSRRPIDFAGLAAALLARAHSLVPMWLPAGAERNDRWYVGDFDGGAGESANVVPAGNAGPNSASRLTVSCREIGRDYVLVAVAGEPELRLLPMAPR